MRVNRFIFLKLGMLAVLLTSQAESLAAPPALAEAAPAAPAKAPEKPPQLPSIWFDDVAFSVPATDSELTAVSKYVRDHAIHGKATASLRATLPASVKADKQPRLVFVSISDAVTPARVALGTGRGMLAATDDALSQIELSAATRKTFEPRWVKVDIVANVFDQSGVDLSENMLYPRSLFGIAFSKQTSAAVLAEETLANELVDHHQAFNLERFTAYIKRRVPVRQGNLKVIDPKKANLFRFSTQSMFADKDETTKLFRGHKLYNRLTKSEVFDAAKLAKNYLLQSLSRGGQFAYIYNADRDEVEQEYSIGHHFSTTLALLETYEDIKDERLIDAAKRAFAFGELRTGSWNLRGHRVYCVTDQRNQVYLRFNGLATLAYAKLVKQLGDKATDEQRDRLYRFTLAIIVAQHRDGYLTQHQSFPDARVHDDITCPVFLPGEAMAALDAVYQVDPKKRWLEALEKTANYVITVRDKDRTVALMVEDPWTLIAMGQLYQTTKKRMYLEHALKTARALRRRLNVETRYVDWFGGHGEPPGTLPTASRTTGLAYAAQLARKAGRNIDADQSLLAAARGASFLMQAQFRPENAMYFKNPQRVLGGFRVSLTVPTVRSNYVQYSLKTLLSLHRIMEAEKLDSIDLQRPKLKKKTAQ